MNIQLAYGHRQISLDVPKKRVLSVVKARKTDQQLSQINSVEEALRCPKNSPTLKELVYQKTAQNAVIVVNDITRPTPYQEILPPILDELRAAGIQEKHITLLIATGKGDHTIWTLRSCLPCKSR
jgi:nickel-dependent lactate racemase